MVNGLIDLLCLNDMCWYTTTCEMITVTSLLLCGTAIIVLFLFLFACLYGCSVVSSNTLKIKKNWCLKEDLPQVAHQLKKMWPEIRAHRSGFDFQHIFCHSVLFNGMCTWCHTVCTTH